MSGREFRIGVDVGGTFTDVICHDVESGTVLVGKSPTESSDPAKGVLWAVEKTLHGTSLAKASHFSHGTTAGLNALLERRGALTGLLCTSGFRDVLEIRRGSRSDAFDLLWKPPAPLVPRKLRQPVRERMRADGSVLEPLVKDDVVEALNLFEAAGVTSIAVSFINAWANPTHEREAAHILRQAGYGGEITASHELSREYREFERTSTATVNAYIRPTVARYLGHLDEGLASRGFSGRFSVMRSGGGTMSAAEAQRRPFEAVFSGPVAGAEAASRVAQQLAAGVAVAADVGGTSFDTTLIVEGRPDVLSEGSVAGLPVQSSWVDVRSIGAGGGSIATVDDGGLLRVGPHSAGSYPGPASYGRGGTDATVTDAAAYLGMLGPATLSSDLALDFELAEKALLPLAERLDLTVTDVARGIIVVSTAAMANAIREITVERGHDPRQASLILFGGAGPLFGTLLASELSIGQVVIPPHAGNFSAWGLLGADDTREASMTFLRRLGEEALEEADKLVDELSASLAGREDSDAELQVTVDVRYHGQEHSLNVPLPDRSSDPQHRARVLAQAFTERYRSVYLHELRHELELVTLRLSLRSASGLRGWPPHRVSAKPARAEPLNAYSFSVGSDLEFQAVERSAVEVGDWVSGPAIVLEETTTTYLDAGFAAVVHESGCLVVRSQGTAA